MLVELTQSDLELMTVVQHCPNLVDFVGGEYVSTLVEVDISDRHRARHVRAESHTAADEFWWALVCGVRLQPASPLPEARGMIKLWLRR